MSEREQLLRIMAALTWPETNLGFLDSSELARAAQWFERGRIVTDFLGNESWEPGGPDWRRVGRVIAEIDADQSSDVRIERTVGSMLGGAPQPCYRITERRA